MDLTWEGLRVLLNSMAEAEHVSMNKRVHFDAGPEGMKFVDIYESLSTGEVHLGVSIDLSEDNDEDEDNG